MNPFSRILQFFKPTRTEPSESHKQWLEGFNAYQKAEALLAARQDRDALGFLDRAISCGYDAHGLAYSARGVCLQALDFHLDAIDDFTKAIAFEPKDSNLYFMRSVSKGATGDFEGCVADRYEAIRVATLHPAANKSHDAYAKELGHTGGIVDFYNMELAFAKVKLEGQAHDELMRREYPDCDLGPDIATRLRAESRRRAT